jgi:DNA-directed RNA polymerase specialized sigma24 family protein
VIDAALIRRARRYAAAIVGADDAPDITGDALLDLVEAQHAGTVVFALWPFLRTVLRRRAADLMQKRARWPRPWDLRRATVDQRGDGDVEWPGDPDHFPDPQTETIEEQAVAHCDLPRIEHAIERTATAKELEAVQAWLYADTMPDAARALGVSLRSAHRNASAAVQKARRELGVDAPPVIVLSRLRAPALGVPASVVADIIRAPLTPGSGAALARRHGLSPQQISRIRKEHGLAVPAKRRQRLTACKHVNRPPAAHGMCGACANRHRARLRSAAA